MNAPVPVEPRAVILARLRAAHNKGYRNTSDEAWQRDPICTGCEHQWPCDTAEALALLDVPVPADVDTLVETTLDAIARRTESFIASTVEIDLRDVATQAYAAGRQVAETMRGDVHHHINPAIGWLDYRFGKATGIALSDLETDGVARPPRGDIPEDVALPTETILAIFQAMRAATDAADAALGEEPMRVQIERVQAEISAAKATPNGDPR